MKVGSCGVEPLSLHGICRLLETLVANKLDRHMTLRRLERRDAECILTHTCGLLSGAGL